MRRTVFFFATSSQSAGSTFEEHGRGQRTLLSANLAKGVRGRLSY